LKILSLTPLALLLTLAGCVSVPNILENKVTSVNEIKIGNNEFSLSHLLARVEREQWWKSFNDEQLNNLMDKVLSTNIDSKIAQLNIDKVEQLVKLTNSANYPQVNLDATIQKQKLSSQGFSPPPIGGTTINFAQIGLSGSYNLDLFNKINNEVASQELKKQSLILQKQALELALSVQTFKLYGYWQYLNSQKTLYLEQRKVSEELLVSTEKKVKLGLGTIDEVLQIQNIQKNIDIAISQINVNQDTTISALLQLTGVIDRNLIVLKSSKIISNLPSPINAVNSAVIMSRPDIQSYMVNIESQRKHLSSLKADFYPSVSLNGEVGLQKIGLSNLVRSGNVFATIMPTISLPIFDAGRIQTNYKIAGVDLNIFIEQYNNTVVKSYYDINDSISKVKKTFEIYNIQNSALDNESQKLNLEQKL
jgi:NodT family efflux transporter outer membrane factor (OMF) lipoprotein